MLGEPGFLVTAFLSVVVAFLSYLSTLIWRHHRAPGVRYLMCLIVSGIVWTTFYVLEVRSHDISAKVLWAKAKYLGITVAPVAWFLFIVKYIGYPETWGPRGDMALFVVPTITLLAIATNPWHSLFWRTFSSQYCEGLLYLNVKHTFFFWFHTAYSHLLLLAGFLILLHVLFRFHRFYRAQILTIIAAALFPWIGNLLYLANATPCIFRDPTPFAFLLTGGVVMLGILRFRWLDLVPVARTVVLETMQEGVIVIDDQQRIVDLNPAAAEIIDALPQRAMGDLISNVLPDWSQISEDCLASPTVTRNLTVERENESHIYEIRVSSLRRERAVNAQVGHVILLHEITAYVRAVEEREQVIQDLDAFAYTVAHDLKNPVGTMVTAVQLLRNECTSLPVEEIEILSDVIARGGKKVTNIIEEILVLTGVQRDIEVTFQPLDMAAITIEALQRLDDLIQKSGARVQKPDVWPTALGHAPWVEEVWVNYISNAIKYGGTPPQMQLGADPPAAGHVRFWIQDNGAGVTEYDTDQLFTPFTRLDETCPSGYGLGLAIVKRIVNHLNGNVGVENLEGLGCKFYFTLPAAKQPLMDKEHR